MTKKTLIVLVVVALTFRGYAQEIQLASQGGVNVTYNAHKIASEKKRDRWSVAVSVTVPASGIYYVERLTGVPGVDVFIDEYLTVTVPNRSNKIIPMEKRMVASRANLMSEDNGLVFQVVNGPGLAFDVMMPTGQAPDVKASFNRTFVLLSELNLVQASDQDQFAAAFPQSRMFVTYAELDTLIPQRNREIHYMNSGKQFESASYTNGQFVIQAQGAEKVATQIDYVNWDEMKTSARIAGDHIEISHSGNFDDAKEVSEIRYKDDHGDNKRTIVEKMAKHLLLPGDKLLPGQSLVSANGKYTLKMQTDGNLVLYDQDGQVVWATNTNGHPVLMADMQRNGNFLLTSIGPPAWQSKTKEEGSYLSVTDNGNIILYRPDGLGIWQSNPAR